MKPGGVYVSLRGLPDQDEAKSFGVRGISADGPAGQDQFALSARLVEQGAIKPIVTKTWPLDQVREALSELKAGHAQGKLVLTVA
jgi:NADPH:quinone reductase-like Zn-dependent oxidoreductase